MNKNLKIAFKIFLAFLIMGVIVFFFSTGLYRVFKPDFIETHIEQLMILFHEHKVVVGFSYVVLYIVTTAFSLPTSLVFTLTGGALFGVLGGALLADFSASTGAVIAFLAARFLLRDVLEKKYARFVSTINGHLNQNAWFYILFLRLVPVFPYFIINPVLGLSRLPLSTFYFASVVGMLPGALIYANVGAQLATLRSFHDLHSPRFLVAFGLLGCLVLIPVLIKPFYTRRHKSTKGDAKA